MIHSPLPLNFMEPKCDLPSTLSSSSSLLSTLLFSHQYQYQYQYQHSLQTNQRNQENVILATSSSGPRLQREQTSADVPSPPPPLDKFVLPGNNKTTTDTSHLCSDQKGFLDHLKPRSLFISTLRVSTLQISQILTSYIADQIHHESSLEKKIKEGKISLAESEQLSHQWEEIEWSKRWKTFPKKVQVALVKYHALVLFMRFYEYMIGKCVKDGLFLLDRLTKDAFKAAIVKSRRRMEEPFALETNSTKNYAMEMFETCVYSNAISFLADYSIQQGILIYGYYLYVKNVQRNNRLQRFQQEQSLNLDYELVPSVQDDLVLPPQEEGGGGVCTEGGVAKDDGDHHEIEKEQQDQPQSQSECNISSYIPKDIGHYQSGGLLLSFMYKSSQLLVSRAIGLLMAGIGGAVGSLMKPGWGTMVGVQLGDACVSALLET